MMGSKRRSRRTTISSCYANRMSSTRFLICMMLLLCCCFLSSARDTIKLNSLICDDGEQSLISAGKRFELGFYTPGGSSSNRRYVGIWYHGSNPRTVVWVANRDSPVLGSGGVLAIAEDGNLKVLDRSGSSYWGTNLERSSATHATVRLMDSGNLVMSQESAHDQPMKVLWQSFENPTDTFLPGMKIDSNLVLSSWRSEDDPATGNFTFQQDQGADQLIIWKRSMRYWKSGVSDKFIGADEMPSAIFYLLSNFTSSFHNETVPHITSSLYSDTRLVLRFSGQIQYLKWDSERIWSLVWGEPRDRCSLFNICGNFGTCNNNYELMCKCLPGFGPSLPENWSSGDFSGGCSRKSALCGKNAQSDTFLNLKMMKVGNPDSQFKAGSEKECRMECLNNCHCQAYSYEEDAETRTGAAGSAACWIWSDDLNNLQEDYNNGRNLNIRIAVADIESTARNCETCGTNLIPYPLSTGPKCGDPMYFDFHCNVSSGHLTFISPSGTYQVTSTNPETRRFIIETKDETQCEAQNTIDKNLQLNQSSPFSVTNWCYAAPTDSDSGLPVKGGDEVEVGWDPPSEPICSSPTDCKDWPDSTCNTTRNGVKRCLCNAKLQWDGVKLNCTEERSKQGFIRGNMSLVLVIMITFASVIVLTILLYSIFYVCVQRRKMTKKQGSRGSTQRSAAHQLYDRERQAKDLIDSGRFEEDDGKAIDVPFFDMETVLVSTDYFSNSNKLGQGGFGAVYKGMFPGGQDIAVKRLSSCSGQGLEEFKNEVVLIAKLQHRNLVRLLGYCVTGEEKMLLYEYMPNKSLDFFLFDRKISMLLDWGMRFNIILGIARGLLYLHQDSRLRIIHRDLKTSNILLDEEMNPKISDFGLARIFGGKETAVNTNRVVGTYGYMSPEYALDGLFSFKSDVFSFGVVMIEIISGKRNTGFYQPEQGLSLLGYAWKLWKQDMAQEMIDETLRETCDRNEYLKCVNVGLLCVQEDPSDRPTMSNVVFMLASETATLPTPKQPAFIVRRCLSSTASSSSKPESFSHNSLTVTIEAGR